MDSNRLTDLLRSAGHGATRIDRLARSLSTAHSRRGALATLLGGTLGLFSLSDGDAKRHRRRRNQGSGKNKKKKCRAAQRCPEGCCPDGSVCHLEACCTEDIEAVCESAGATCGEHLGPCGRYVNCGACPTGSICETVACCRDLGQSCGASFGGAPCCSDTCRAKTSQGDFVCRKVNCLARLSSCTRTSDCCEGECRRVDGRTVCTGIGPLP